MTVQKKITYSGEINDIAMKCLLCDNGRNSSIRQSQFQIRKSLSEYRIINITDSIR